jgi:hypothetical protein
MNFNVPVSGQTSYNFLMNVGSAGQLYDVGFNNVLTPVTTQILFPGQGVAKYIGLDQTIRLPWVDIVTLNASVPLVTGNSTIVTLNGIALAPVVYMTSNTVTLANIAALIASQIGIASAVSDGSANITITATQGLPVIATAVTTSGSGQPTWTSNYSNDAVFYGVAVYIQNKANLLGPQGSAGPSPYLVGDPVPTITRGRIWVLSETTVTSDSPVYWRIKPTVSFPVTGTFRGDSDGGNAILLSSSIIRWWQGASAGSLGILDINMP